MKEHNDKSGKRIVKNSLLWFFLLAVGCLTVQFLAVEYHFNRIADVHWLSTVSIGELCRLVVNNIADALLLLTPFVALGGKWRKWSWLIIWIVTLWCLAQLLYMPSYRDLMPLSSFFLVENVGGTVAKSAVGAFRLSNLEVLLPPIVLYIVYRIWFKRGIDATHQHFGFAIIWLIKVIITEVFGGVSQLAHHH